MIASDIALAVAENVDRALADAGAPPIRPSMGSITARVRGAKIKLVSFEEETDPALIAAFDPADHRAIPVGKLGQISRTRSNCNRSSAGRNACGHWARSITKRAEQRQG